MNRKNLTAAVLAGLAGVVGIAGSAQAVNINPDGTGQVLLYPYYTINGGNQTIFSVINTSEDAKAVKVRFLESENSQEVLDFNLYMSAFDVWSAAISEIPDGMSYPDCDLLGTGVVCEGPLLTIADDETTCTVPQLNGMQPFLPFKYLDDGGTQDQSRMNAGHFEMIEMGTLIEGEWAAVAATHILHEVTDPDDTTVPPVVIDTFWAPASCDVLTLAWTDLDINAPGGEGRWLVDPTDGVSAPSGGLFGGAAIINVMGGNMHTYDAMALNGWNRSGFTFGPEGDSIHAQPGFTEPTLASGDSVVGSVFTEAGFALDSGDLEEPIDAVSYVLMHDAIMNEYTTEKAVLAQTEWVVTFPTKRFYVNQSPVRAPFTTEWDYTEFDLDDDDELVPVGLATACETVELDRMYDREERYPGDPECGTPGGEACPLPGGPIVSPAPPIDPVDPLAPILFNLCYESNVIRFGGDAYHIPGAGKPNMTEILGAPQYLNFDNEEAGYQYGWARIELDDYIDVTALPGGGFIAVEASRDPIGLLNGLPTTGFAVSKFYNGFLTDLQGNRVLSAYGGLVDHRSSRKVGSD
ncbi:MAG: hypothetical protein OEU84_05895 [Xanthomonadales bacterium]|nr:hypothetical protein [Xanthomonadales bacterium]